MTATDASFHRWDGDTLILRLRVQPRASRTALGERLGDRIKLYLNAPPVDGKANAALITFLADTFGVAKGRIYIHRGKHGRGKEVRIVDPTRLPTEIPQRANV